MKRTLRIMAVAVLFCCSLPLAFAASKSNSSSGSDGEGKYTLSEVFEMIKNPDKSKKKNKTSVKETVKETSEALSKANEDIPPEEAYYLGRAVAGKVFGSYKRYKNTALDTYLNEICTALVINSKDPVLYNGYHVAVLDSNELNAFSTPGGHILITKGLVKCSNSEDSLAAVLAHEIAHIQLKPPLSAIKTSRNLEVLANAANTAMKGKESEAAFAKCVDSITDNFSSGYSQQNEFNADTTALRLLNDTGYDPKAMLDMLKLLDANTNENSTGFGKTHPSPKLRIANVQTGLQAYTSLVDSSSAARQKRYDAVMKKL